MRYESQHWTDDAATPVFRTAIPAGNIFEMLGAAERLLREIDVPRDRIGRLCEDVMAAANYEQACALIGHWFPISGGESV